jgi:polysaccharide biosynthesis transport protein
MLVTPGQRSDASRSPSLASTEHLDLYDVVRVLRRRKRTICLTVLLLTLLSVALVAVLPKRYTAAVEVLIEPPEKKVIDTTGTTGVAEEIAPQDQQMIDTEVKFLTSRSFVEQTAERMALADDPEFNPYAVVADASDTTDEVAEQEPAGWLSQWLPEGRLREVAVRGTAWLDRWLSLPPSVVRAKEAEPATATPPPDAAERILDILLANLSVEQAETAYVIRGSATSRSPEKAAAIANTMADVYVSGLLEGKQSKTGRVVDWLKERLEQLRKQLIEGDQAIATYKKEHHLITSDGRTPVRASSAS